jgi:hypothetical protein
MALFAFIWGLLADYWHSKDTSNTPTQLLLHVGVYTSFLNIYIGGLLASYAHQIKAATKSRAVSCWQIVSLPLLFLVFSDRDLSIPIIDVPLTTKQIAVGVDLGLGTLGFYAVGSGMWILGGRLVSILLFIVFFFYTLATIGPTLIEFRMPEPFNLGTGWIAWTNAHHERFATILKVPYIIIFALAITYIGMTPIYRKTCIWKYVGRVVRPPKPAPNASSNMQSAPAAQT